MYKKETLLQEILKRDPQQAEFLQAVEEFLDSVIDFVNSDQRYEKNKILERMLEPERMITFRVTWVDDQGEIQVNRGFRVQFNSAIGPYKGGLRFHPSVNLSILKFLGFEQTFKNSLTGLSMGGGKGGSDFDPHGKSDGEVMRFCQAFMTELYRHIGSDCDIPAGDIGVGGREVAYMFGMYKKLVNEFTGTFTGKGISFGGSLIRPEATGYGLVYFTEAILHTKGDSIKGKTILVSGAGNVAQYAVEKAISLGAKVVTMSDSSGYIFDQSGINSEKLAYIFDIKNRLRGRIKEYLKKYPQAQYFEGQKPWKQKADIALPCATQNEIDAKDAADLIKSGISIVAEGANMPSTLEAIKLFHEAKILFSPGKASNAGGVAVSGLEMSQNSQRLSWNRADVDAKLQSIMKNIHQICLENGKEEAYINYVKGANIGGFKKVAAAMLEQGIV
ncbi:MAG: NADP-specific glutamate dehydrogenase [bacterium]